MNYRLHPLPLKSLIVKISLVHIWLFCTVTASWCQRIDREKVLHTYEAYLGKYVELGDCGRIANNPLYMLKQAERKVVDGLFKVTAQEQKQLGREIHGHLSQELQFVEQHWGEEFMDNAMLKICTQIRRPNASRSYSYQIIESEEINAFATIGGYLYVTTGLLEFVRSEDELAFVVGHEIAHLEMGHTLRKQKKLLSIARLAKLSKMEQLAGLVSDIELMLAAPFSQVDEYEADKKAFELAVSAGYEQEQFSAIFERLAEQEEESLIQKLLSTHPFAVKRQECIEYYIEKAGID